MTMTNPKQQSSQELFETFSNVNALWLGEHHNSREDHILQEHIIRSIHDLRMGRGKEGEGRQQHHNMAVGLEMVQKQFQPILDDYIDGKLSSDELRRGVDWDRRWSWSYENYLPIFETCRELQIPLVALNVNSEDLGLVEIGGFPSLPKERISQYISDPKGFAQFAKEPYYGQYVDYVIYPSYELHRDMGILRTTITGQRLDEDMPFERFFSGRILWDESMASNAYRWISKSSSTMMAKQQEQQQEEAQSSSPQPLMIGLVGADHVKFVGGITGRYDRMAASSADDNKKTSLAVMLNPTLIDTRPSGSVSWMSNAEAYERGGVDRLTLQLRYVNPGVDRRSPSEERRLPQNTGGVLPLADYLLISSPSSSA